MMKPSLTAVNGAILPDFQARPLSVRCRYTTELADGRDLRENQREMRLLVSRGAVIRSLEMVETPGMRD